MFSFLWYDFEMETGGFSLCLEEEKSSKTLLIVIIKGKFCSIFVFVQSSFQFSAGMFQALKNVSWDSCKYNVRQKRVEKISLRLNARTFCPNESRRTIK